MATTEEALVESNRVAQAYAQIDAAFHAVGMHITQIWLYNEGPAVCPSIGFDSTPVAIHCRIDYCKLDQPASLTPEEVLAHLQKEHAYG